MKKMKIVLTGGGTAGHVTPNIALLPALEKRGYEIYYIGSYTGIERGLISLCGIKYYGISSGKLRRYFDLKNVTDTFRIAKGLIDAIKLLKQIRPDIVFSKGGFVVVPVVFAANMLGIPVVIHESDLTPGLATRLAMPFAKTICTSFPETLKWVAKGKGALTGSPVRVSLYSGSRSEGLRLCGFNYLPAKPVILITGGSLGSVIINRNIFEILARLLKLFHVIHLCGKGNIKEDSRPGYAPFEYAQEEMPHMLAAADIVISRAGANTIFELLALGKPNLLIPLSKNASRGDQILNAASFEKQGYSKVLQEEEMSADSLYEAILALYAKRGDYVKKMKASRPTEGVERVMAEIERWTKGTAT